MSEIDIINFYTTKGEYGCFSNFSRHPIYIDSIFYPTSEHFYQAEKCVEPDYREKIRGATTPGDAARLGRSRDFTLREDWETIKDYIMLRAVTQKFYQHSDIRATLLSTGSARLVEHTVNDRYWGDGGDGTGLNMLGKILMMVRGMLRSDDK